MSAGARHSLALTASHVVYAFGNNDFGQVRMYGARPHDTTPLASSSSPCTPATAPASSAATSASLPASSSSKNTSLPLLSMSSHGGMRLSRMFLEVFSIDVRRDADAGYADSADLDVFPVFKRAELYSLFVHAWVEREAHKRGRVDATTAAVDADFVESVGEFCQKMAFEMFMHDKTQYVRGVNGSRDSMASTPSSVDAPATLDSRALHHHESHQSVRHRAASGMSAVTTTSSRRACSTIQSSAASNAPETTWTRTRGPRGTAIQEFATNTTGSPCRSATLTVSALTGQASPST